MKLGGQKKKSIIQKIWIIQNKKITYSGKVVKSSKADDMFDSDNFSASDKRIHFMANSSGKPHTSYVGTPSGEFKALDSNGVEYLI